MASKSLGLGTLDGHSTHISLLWVVALLAIATFVTVAIYVYAGEQQDLGERHFNKVKVDGRVDAAGFIETDKTLSLTSGGTSTQATEDGPVTLNTYTGQIALASTDIGISSGSTSDFTFLVNNNKVDANDVVVLSTGTSAGAQQLLCTAGDVQAGSFKVTCDNIGPPLTDYEGTINFAVIKGTTS